VVEHALRAAALVDDRAIGLSQPSDLEGELTVVLVQVELAALGASLAGGVRVVDGDRDTVDVQDPGQGEPAETGPDDRDWSGHGVPLSRYWTSGPLRTIGPPVHLCQDESMSGSPPRNPRRSDALSRERIVEASIHILDTAGENGLTVRAVTAHLSTGRGAIYHHITGKDELLAAAADGVISQVTARAVTEAPAEALRALSLGIFDAIDAHPWVGAQLSREPFQPAVLRIWKGIGEQLRKLGITGTAQSDAGSALANYVLGAAAQYAAGARKAPDDVARRHYLEALAAQWQQLDDDPIVHESAALLREHDDREQFLAGVDIFLAGITAGG
jgi:AcrR family transcriptional regulator